jgi:hypothetical protein
MLCAVRMVELWVCKTALMQLRVPVLECAGWHGGASAEGVVSNPFFVKVLSPKDSVGRRAV